MIFGVLYFCVLSCYSAIGLLLGSYFLAHTGATEIELGFLFMLQPLTIFARPFICAQADRYQSHKKLLKRCLLGATFAYLPYIALPYLLEIPAVNYFLTFRLRFGILAGAHLVGSVCYCGIRSLVDALTINYAKRIGSDFSVYRKWGTLSFGCCGLLIGQINQGWLLPDYVPALAFFCISMFTGFIFTHLWPDEFFNMIDDEPLPTGREVASHISAKVKSMLTCTSIENSRDQTLDQNSSIKSTRYLSTNQQRQILWLLLKQDYRITLYLLLLLFGGLTGYAPQNFVFTYMKIYCQTRGTCDAASLAGLSMFAYCIVEIGCFIMIDSLRGRINYVILLLLTFVSLGFHFSFYGYLLDHVSPYFFLIGSLHGLEYAFSIVASVELAFKSAQKVELLIPELKRRGIISERDDLQLVRVSIKALLVGIHTTMYDGVGVIISAPIFGFVISQTSYNFCFKLVSYIAMVVFVITAALIVVGKTLEIRPKIEKIRGQLESKSTLDV